MKLQHSQARRFERIFDALLSFTAEKRGVLDALRSNNRLTSGQTSLDLIAYIWGTPEGLETIDEFIEANPQNFNRTDLREVESWRLGVHDRFVVIDLGPRSILIGHDCAFDVRGINNEIADVFAGNLPGLVEAVVLPFDSTITVGGAILPNSMGAAAALRAHFLTEAKRLTKDRRLARNARDFARIAPIALANKAQEAAKDFAASDSNHVIYDFNKTQDPEEVSAEPASTPVAEPVAEPQVPAPEETVTAPTTPQETPVPVAEEPTVPATDTVAPVDRDALISEIQAQVRKGRPSQGLKGYTSAFKKNELIEIARTFEGVEVSSSLKKGDLVNIVIENAHITSDAILDLARTSGPQALSDLRRVFEAQGRYKVAFDEVVDATSVPAPLFPVTQLYQVDDTFVVVMPSEFRDALADVSWDEIIG